MLVDEQHAFLQDVARLLLKAVELGYVITGGELYRTQEQEDIYVAKGLSHAYNSNHLRRLTIDLNTFKNDELAIPTDLGDYWKSLNGVNRWGGDFASLRDYNHFERNIR